MTGQVNKFGDGRGLAGRAAAQLFLVGAALFHYLGPTFAVLLFARTSASGVVWLRIVSAGLVFAIWRRPWRALVGADRGTRQQIVLFGTVLALMNHSFYAAITLLPLGTVAAIEFSGPIVLATLGARSRRSMLALLLAVSGVVLLSDARLEGSPRGFAWAFANAGLFTLYIHLAHRVARSSREVRPVDRLGAAMIVAAVAITPLGIAAAVPALADPVVLLGGIGVGVSSSVIPYVFDQLAMARVSRATYALYVALLPATAVVMGALVLHQIPTNLELAAVGFVAAAVLIHRPAEKSA